MTTLPGSALWLFLLVYFACGQISDITSLDYPKTGFDEVKNTTVNSHLQHHDTEKENKMPETEGREKEDEEENKGNNKVSSLLLNKTVTAKPRAFSENPQNFIGKDSLSNKKKGRRVTHRTAEPFDVSEIPLISAERRNSYLSIAERRKYYNKTRSQSKKPELGDTESDRIETTRPLVTSTTDTVQTNEIQINNKSILKDSSRVVTNKKNELNSQRVLVGLSSNETQVTPQATRQSVIHSQYQFGQKLNLRKSPRTQDSEDERTKRKQERHKTELIKENSTNISPRNYPTQSTKLIRIDKNGWETTNSPNLEVEMENSVVLSHQSNGTGVQKLSKYIAVNHTQVEANKLVNTTHPVGSIKETKSINENSAFKPLPLSYNNATRVHAIAKKPNEEEEKLVSNVRSVYNQEILKLKTSVNKIEESPTEVTPMEPPVKTSTAELLSNVTGNIHVSTTTIPHSHASEEVFESDVSHSGAFAPSNGTNFDFITSDKHLTDNLTELTTPLIRVVPKEIADRSDASAKENEKGGPEADSDEKVPLNQKNSSQTLSPNLENWSSTQEYPLTIELNENNKRVLSEMFQTSTPTNSLVSENETSNISNSKTADDMSNNKTSTTETTSTSERLDVFLASDSEEDHKAMGTQYNTKFYISPNVSRKHVIKIVENDQDDSEIENAPGILSFRPAGVAIYVLSAFGLIPLLLALVFATKFMMQRHHRQYECESDTKSDISANESQIRQGRKKKGLTDLKKSPSNVTTTTLVTSTRLPRVQHWEEYDKQGNKNWEFPRSKIKLRTILGQGNFGQVWKAEAEDMAGYEGKGHLVAVKTVKEGATETEHAEFLKELEIMRQIGSHPNIVTLLGCCTDQEPYYLIMEYVKHGKLLTYLREHRINENYFNFSNNSDALTSRDLTVFAFCIARGMEYLSSRGIIHRDLAARNVLVDHGKICKVADFGMSRSVRNFDDGRVYEERQHKGALPIRWMAPESLVYSVFTYKSDVWSFGIVMWEIVTLGSTPYPNMGAREVMRKVCDGYRLERPNHCKPEFYRLISRCWAQDQNKRPDFSELRQELSSLLEKPNKDGSYVDLDRFAVDNNFHMSSKTNDLRMLERSEFKTLKRLEKSSEDWPEDAKKSRIKRGKNSGKGTVTLTGQGSFTVNSRILEKEFKMI